MRHLFQTFDVKMLRKNICDYTWVKFDTRGTGGLKIDGHSQIDHNALDTRRHRTFAKNRHGDTVKILGAHV